MKTNWHALGYPKYLEWNLLWYNFCTNFAQRETLTNVHPAATAAVARKLCNFFSFAFHLHTSVATTTYCCCCSMNAVERKFHMKCQIAFFLWVSIALQVNIFLHFAWNWEQALKNCPKNSPIAQSLKQVRSASLELHLHHNCHNYHNPQIAVV